MEPIPSSLGGGSLLASAYATHAMPSPSQPTRRLHDAAVVEAHMHANAALSAGVSRAGART